MKNKKTLAKIFKKSLCLIAAAVMLLSTIALSGCSKKAVDEGAGSKKSISFEIVYEDKTSKKIELETDKDTLALALEEAGIVEYQPSGMYTVIDSVEADFAKDGAWWCITKNGEMLNTGMNDLYIKDGESYEATYTK